MNFRRELGKAKVILERVTGWAGKFNFIMILYLTSIANPDIITYIPGLAVFGVVLLWVDLKYIMPSELTYYYKEKNPAIVEIIDRLERIESRLK